MLFPLHQEGRLSKLSSGLFKRLSLFQDNNTHIFPTRTQENLNIASSYMPFFCLINPKIITCIVKVIGASFVEGRSNEDGTQIPSIWPNYGHQWRIQKANAFDNIWTLLELSTRFVINIAASFFFMEQNLSTCLPGCKAKMKTPQKALIKGNMNLLHHFPFSILQIPQLSRSLRMRMHVAISVTFNLPTNRYFYQCGTSLMVKWKFWCVLWQMVVPNSKNQFLCRSNWVVHFLHGTLTHWKTWHHSPVCTH